MSSIQHPSTGAVLIRVGSAVVEITMIDKEGNSYLLAVNTSQAIATISSS